MAGAANGLAGDNLKVGVVVSLTIRVVENVTCGEAVVAKADAATSVALRLRRPAAAFFAIGVTVLTQTIDVEVLRGWTADATVDAGTYAAVGYRAQRGAARANTVSVSIHSQGAYVIAGGNTIGKNVDDISAAQRLGGSLETKAVRRALLRPGPRAPAEAVVIAIQAEASTAKGKWWTCAHAGVTVGKLCARVTLSGTRSSAASTTLWVAGATGAQVSK